MKIGWRDSWVGRDWDFFFGIVDATQKFESGQNCLDKSKMNCSRKNVPAYSDFPRYESGPGRNARIDRPKKFENRASKYG